jgi:hypothetical protein
MDLSPLQGSARGGGTSPQAVGLGWDSSPLWGLRRMVAELSHTTLQAGKIWKLDAGYAERS